MNRQQKAILIKFTTVIVITAIVVVAMINFKDWVNRSEAMRAMEALGQEALKYRENNGSMPPESYIDRIRKKFPGNVRLGKLQYRAMWIEFDSTPDEILAYNERQYHSLLFGSGFIVLRLDGRIEWMGKEEFKELLAQQQSPMEIEMLRE